MKISKISLASVIQNLNNINLLSFKTKRFTTFNYEETSKYGVGSVCMCA